MIIADDIISGAVVGLVGKGDNWLTVSALQKVPTIDDLEKLFSHPCIKKYVDLENVKDSLKCGIICSANIFTAPAKNFYGSGWIAIGDLTGYGRVLKDGYYHSLKQAYLAAHSIVYGGIAKEDFEKNFEPKIKSQVFDNMIGMRLFYLNERLEKFSSFKKFYIKAGRSKYIKTAIKNLVTGELSYEMIGLFIVLGLAEQLIISSFKKI